MSRSSLQDNKIYWWISLSADYIHFHKNTSARWAPKLWLYRGTPHSTLNRFRREDFHWQVLHNHLKDKASNKRRSFWQGQSCLRANATKAPSWWSCRIFLVPVSACPPHTLASQTAWSATNYIKHSVTLAVDRASPQQDAWTVPW